MRVELPRASDRSDRICAPSVACGLGHSVYSETDLESLLHAIATLFGMRAATPASVESRLYSRVQAHI
eukprot:9438100-Alexandrium_andersonii.AAC.1